MSLEMIIVALVTFQNTCTLFTLNLNKWIINFQLWLNLKLFLRFKLCGDNIIINSYRFKFPIILLLLSLCLVIIWLIINLFIFFDCLILLEIVLLMINILDWLLVLLKIIIWNAILIKGWMDTLYALNHLINLKFRISLHLILKNIWVWIYRHRTIDLLFLLSLLIVKGWKRAKTLLLKQILANPCLHILLLLF